MTDLAPILQGFFTDRLARQKKASPNTVAAYRDTCRLLLTFAQERDREGTQPAQPRRPRRHADRRVPAAPGRRPGQRQRHPQRPAGRDPLAVQLRSPAGTRARRRHQPGPGHPAPAPRAGHRQLPHPRRDRRADRRPRPQDLARPPRPRPSPARRPDRAAGIRAHRPDLPGRPPGRRPARPLPRQGPQRPGHPAHPADRQGAQDLARRARPQPGRPAVPRPRPAAGSPATPSRCSSQSTQPRPRSRLPVHQGEERHPAHAQAHRRHVPPARRVDTSVIALWLGHFSGVPELSPTVTRSRLERGRCQTLWILCATCVTVSREGDHHEGAACRADRHARLLDCRRRRLAGCPGR